MQLDRRQFTGLLAATLAMPSIEAHALTVRGVQLGLQTYTFHNVREGGPAAVDTIIAGSKRLNVDLIELWAPLIEPFPMPSGYWRNFAQPPVPAPAPASPDAAKAQREKLRAFRINPPADYFPSIRAKFAKGGIRIFAYNYSFDPSMTDDEINAGFLHAKAMGLNLITASSRISAAQRVVPFAAKHNMRVAFHGHSEKDDPDQVAGPDSFAKVLAMSPLYRVNLDVAHYAAAGFDAVAYLKEHHAVITNIHVHDRKANAGASVPFGQGVAPTRDVLTLIRDRKWKVPVFYELEYAGGDGRDVIAETARELDYEKKILEA
jgi:sugar phosphate isomerase/epimerase